MADIAIGLLCSVGGVLATVVAVLGLARAASRGERRRNRRVVESELHIR